MRFFSIVFLKGRFVMGMDVVRDVLENSPERVYRRVTRDYRRPVGSEGWEFEVFVLSDTASSDALLGSGVGLVHRANFEFLVNKFSSEGWPWFVTAQSFSVPVDAPVEVLEYLVGVVRSLEEYPVLDEELYSDFEYGVIFEFIEGETERLASEFDVDYDDIVHVVQEAVFESYEFDDVNVFVEDGLLEEVVEEFLGV